MDLPIFISGNESKIREISRYVGFDVPHQKIDLIEVQSLDLTEVVEHKTREAYRILQKPVFVEDTALTFTALGQLPGPLVKWFIESMGLEAMCKILDSYDDRSAIAETRFGLCNGTDVKQFSGLRYGTIAQKPRGEKKFGWDPIFIPEGFDKTWAEMTLEEKSAASMRRLAIEKLREYLSANV